MKVDYTKHIIYNKEKAYVLYYELDKNEVLYKNKVTMLYHKGISKHLFTKYKNLIQEVKKVYITQQDIINTIKQVDMYYIELTLQTKTKHKHNVRTALNNYFDFLNDKDIKRSVIKCGTTPIRYIPRRLP